MKKYRKKPLVVQAVEINVNILSHPIFGLSVCQAERNPESGTMKFLIKTKYGYAKCYDGDYLIIGIEGEIYPCKRDVFMKSYVEITPTQPNPFIEEGDPE